MIEGGRWANFDPILAIKIRALIKLGEKPMRKNHVTASHVHSFFTRTSKI